MFWTTVIQDGQCCLLFTGGLYTSYIRIEFGLKDILCKPKMVYSVYCQEIPEGVNGPLGAVGKIYLIFWCVVALRKVAVDLSIVQQVVVDQVPAPALIVAAQQGHVALTLHGRPLGGDADDGHRAKGAFPPDLPGVPAFREADLAARAVRALGDGVPVKSEAVLLHVYIAGTIMRA